MMDYVIIGGGASACVLAERLSRHPDCQVCLLEAGPADTSPLIHAPAGILPLMHSRRLNWGLHTTPQPALNGRRLFWPRGKTLGGSSAINAMCCTRGQPQDYDGWAAEDKALPAGTFNRYCPIFGRLNIIR
jgi:choline dehydrogenase-like flavoprotein